MHKKCRICEKAKSINDFHKKKNAKDGHRNECKECIKEIQKKYKEVPGFKEKQKDYDKKRYEEKRDEILKRKKEYHIENRERILEYKKEYREENKERIKEYMDNYRDNNREKLREYIKNNPDKNSRIQKEYRKRYPYIIAWRSVLHSTLKRLGTKKQDKTINLLGYSALDLKHHLESKFSNGMSWDNHGEWEIDHIRPVTSFSPSTPMKEVCSLNNLQPLWKKDNLSKSNKIF